LGSAGRDISLPNFLQIVTFRFVPLKQVLIIEDNPMICELLVAILQDQYQVITAAEGEAGLAQALRDAPDLILCDVLMPGLHGQQVAARLQENPVTAKIPFVLMSGHGDFQQSQTAGLFLQKPFAPDEVLRVIDRAFSRAQG
jgi:CheY-like chemotaxis protein